MSLDSNAEVERAEHVGASRYWIVWALLLAGTVLTYVLSRVHLPSPFHLLVALAIACAKSGLVVLFFMHLYDHGGASRLVFATAVSFIALLIGLVVLDNATRYELTNPGRGPTLSRVPPGPDRLTPRALPEPTLPTPEPGTIPGTAGEPAR